MSAAAEMLPAIAEALGGAGMDEAELFVKRGRTVRFEIGPHGRIAGESRERGWAVRASGRRSSLFAAGSGDPAPSGPWPEPDGLPLPLPEPEPPAPWEAPPGVGAPVMAEGESVALLEALERKLVEELPGAELHFAELVDGASEVELASSRGIAAAYRQRLSVLRLEAALPGRAPARAEAHWAAPQGRDFNPVALARRVADLLVLARGKPLEARDRGDVILAPPLAAALVAGLAPLLVGPRGAELARRLRDRSGRIGSAQLTIVDDGRPPRGLLSAPVDGEGVPTRRVRLVEAGRYRQPLVAWWQAAAGQRASGCSRRAGWRDLPRPGATHLFIEPQPAVPASSLLGSVSRGYFLLQELGAGSFDFAADRFRMPVCGFALRQGEPTRAISRAWLCGGVGALLQGIQGVARDLAFRPLDGLVGSPSLRVVGLELRPGDERAPDRSRPRGR